MIVSIIGIPPIKDQDNRYKTKRECEKAMDALNILAIAAILAQDEGTTKSGARLDLNYDTGKHSYTTANCSGFYTLDGSAESIFHLMRHTYVYEKIMDILRPNLKSPL